MPFFDATKSLVEQSIEIAREAADAERIERAFRFEDYRLGDQLGRVPTVNGDGFDYGAEMRLAFPFFSRIVGELGLTYKQAPRRYFDSDKPTRGNGGIWKKSKHDEEVARWHDLAEEDESDYHPTLRNGDALTRTHGRSIARIWPAYDLGTKGATSGKNYPRIDIFHPGQFDVVTDPLHCTRPLSVVLYLSTETASEGANLAQVWTEDEIVEVENGERGPAMPNKLGELPFVGLANYVDPQSYWRTGLADKIVPINAVFDLGMTHLFCMAVQQAHGQPVAKNPDPKWAKNPVWGWRKLIKLEDDGEFKFADAGADLPGMLLVMAKIFEHAHYVAGLPTNRFKDNYTPASGAAYRLENASILEDRQERAALFAPRERAIWRMAFRVARAFNISQLPDPKSIIVDFAEPEIPVASTEALAEREADLKAGLTSMVDIYRRGNPDIMGDEEALEELRRNAVINAEFLGVKAAPTLRDLVAASKAAKTASVGEAMPGGEADPEAVDEGAGE